MITVFTEQLYILDTCKKRSPVNRFSQDFFFKCFCSFGVNFGRLWSLEEEKIIWQSVFQVDKVMEIPPYFVGIAVVSFAPYAAFLFSWDYAIIIADKSCLLPWLQIDARGALKLAFPLQKSSFCASCSGFNPFVQDFTVFPNVYFPFTFPRARLSRHLCTFSQKTIEFR